MAEAAKSCVFANRMAWALRINLHHPAVFVARQAVNIAQTSQLPFAAEKGACRWRHRAAIGIHRLRHLRLDVFFGAQHRAPGGGATTAVGEAANDAITEAIVVTEALLGPEHRRGRAGADQPLGGIVQPRDPGDAPITGGIGTHPMPLGVTSQTHHPEPQIGHGLISHTPNQAEEGIPSRQWCAVDFPIGRCQLLHQA